MFEAAAKPSTKRESSPCLSSMRGRCVANHSNSNQIVATVGPYLISFSSVVMVVPLGDMLVPLGELILQLLNVYLQTACIQVLQEQLR